MSWFGKQPGKRPLKVNVFAHMTAHQGMLEQVPLFPYFGPGDIVPTAALSLTLPDTPRVHFYHYNDIPEVILCMASEGGLHRHRPALSPAGHARRDHVHPPAHRPRGQALPDLARSSSA